MRSTRTVFYALLSLLAIEVINRPLQTFAAETSVVTGNTAFAFDLYGQLKSAEGNLFFSPYSISTCLAMTYAGARGETEAQMARTLHFATDQEEFHIVFGDLQKQINAIQGKKNVELNIANGLWAQKEHPFLAPFLETATKDYAARLEQVDFRVAAEAARNEINGWVSDRTKGRILNLIGPGVLNAQTRLVLVNAIYFKGTWVFQFNKQRTADAPFFASPGQKTQVKMMNTSAHFNYAEADKIQFLELPYRGGDISMVVLLPKENDGLKSLEDSLTQQQLDGWIAQAHSREVNVFLPKFKLTQEFGLAKTLRALGMSDAFSSAADLSGMDGMRDLYISAVIHKAFVEVNEEGTEAAAATGVTVGALAVRRPEPPAIFRADHPFLFLLRDTHSGSILFMGRVMDPSK
jgi:serpin B